MARRSREDSPDTVHHVCNRGVDGRRLFLDDEDREVCLSLLGRWSRELGIRCLGWSLPFNHLHLLLWRADQSIGDFMQRVLGAYAIYFNRKYGRVGHVVQRRYESRLIADDADLRWQLAYTLGNLVRHEITTTAQLGNSPMSGYAGAMGLRAPLDFEAWSDALRAFDHDVTKAREALRNLIAWAEAGVWRPKEERLDALIASECEKRRIGRAELATKRPDATRARNVTVARAAHELGLTRAEIARALEISVSAVSRSLASWRRGTPNR